jgi:L,D-transpeptidase-like protein
MWREGFVSTKTHDQNHEFPAVVGAELSIQGARRAATFRARNGFASVCTLALCASFGLALGAAPASAQYYGFDYGFRHKPRHRAVQHVGKEKNVSKDPFGDIPKGPLQIFISIDQQKLHLYSDGMHVADTSVATGVPSLPTPVGVFSVIQKQVFHRSNIYSNAPMPFMQRITWSGVAMHEGEGIGHQASHGCIRMPHDFAVRLYHLTKLGVPVIVARPELRPDEFADPHLFVHRDKAPEQIAAVPLSSDPAPAVRPADAGKMFNPAPTAAADTADPAALGLRVSADSGAAAPDRAADAAAHDPAINAPAKSVTAAAAEVSAAAPADPKTEPSAPDAAAPAPAAPDDSVPVPPAEPAVLVKDAPASKAPIAIFISRKEKKIYVRQDFAPLFQAPVTIADPDRPFGTHVFTAMGFTGDDHTTLRWNVVSLPGEPPPQPKRKTEREARYEKHVRGRNRGEEGEKLGDLPPPQTPADALARIGIPQAAIDYISQMIVPGSSLIVSDHGLGEETGEGTNFVVVAR